jgi:hypothetical protein
MRESARLADFRIADKLLKDTEEEACPFSGCICYAISVGK